MSPQAHLRSLPVHLHAWRFSTTLKTAGADWTPRGLPARTILARSSPPGQLHTDRDTILALCQQIEPSEFTRGKAQVRCWDVADLDSWSSLGRKVRVVRTVETTSVKRQLNGKKEELTANWVWVTTANALRVPARAVVALGHSRWDIENRGFNEGVTHFHMNHVYRHEPVAMLAMNLLTMLAMNLLGAFYRRSLKPARRARESLLHVARCIAAVLYGGRQLSFAPT